MGDNASFKVLNISDILPNRFQPRIKFEDDALDELAESINKFGVIEPIVVRPIGNKYEIIAGERRYKASKLASKATIPSIVISLSDKDSEELALLENVQRQSLNPIEEAVSYKRILDMGYITREELSKKIGKPQSVILNKTRLLNLADEVQSYLLNNKISEMHARALLNITNLDDQVDMLHRIVNERLTLKKTNREIRNYLENNKEDNTEVLFEKERGNEKVDIDKIMREAQDINAGANVNSAAPDLMAVPSAASQENSSQVIENNPLNNSNVMGQEPNKFVSVQSTVERPVGSETSVNNSVTFDNMFNGPVSVRNSSNEINTPVNQSSVLNSETITPVPTLNEQVSPVTTTTDSNNSINEEISSIVSDALKNQSATVQNINENTNSFSNVPLKDIPDFSINSSTNTEVNQVPIVNNETGMFSQTTNGFSQKDLVNSATDTPNTSSLDEKVNNVSSFSTPIPNDGLVANSVVSPIPQINASVSENSQVNVSNTVPNFARIVEKLRACADEIEKSGNFINLEEVDLGNQYKVIFTFDK